MTVQVTTTLAETWELLDAARAEGKTVGLAPTMGFLHAGHASLIQASAAENDVTLTTIFVNPLQFGADEDLSDYPRDLERDLKLCQESGATIVLTPSVDEMYPQPIVTTVTVNELSEAMEGAQRPTHFAGVATVVAKLFHIGGRCRAYFGEKDYQQLAVVRRMVSDLSFQVQVIGCPIVREENGLAMSSRNTYLSTEQFAAAAMLNRSLRSAVELVQAGERDADVVRSHIIDMIATEPLVSAPDYVAIVGADSLQPLTQLSGDVRIILAAQVGRPRLLDNIGVSLDR
jgi:pantoate--beta-alanine ligase